MTLKKLKAQTLIPARWDRLRLKNLLQRFAGRRILVIGDVGVDRYTIGVVERISPEAPVPVLRVEEEKLKLGLAANVADNVQALGGHPLLIGAVGEDRAADDFRRLLKASGIPHGHLISDPTRRTVLKERIVTERQQLLRVDYESLHSIDSEVSGRLEKRIVALMGKCDAVVIADYVKGLLSKKVFQRIFAEEKRRGVPVIVDAKRTDFAFYRGANLLKPNLKEAETLSGLRIVDEATLLEAGSRILERSGAKALIITRGKEGMAIFRAGVREVQLIPTYTREVYDVSGAGDTVITVLALALSVGATLEEAATLGNLAAGVEVGKRGTATVTQDEVRTAMDFWGARA